MNSPSDWQITIPPGGDATLQRFSLNPGHVFDDPRITVWRDLPERQNAYMLASSISIAPARLHIKRYKSPHGPEAATEAGAVELLRQAGIATVPLVAWGTSPDGRGFLISSDLTGMIPSDQAIRNRASDRDILPRIAALAAKLHRSGLHHRDLYLCHFFVDPEDDRSEIHLIDPGRVSRLPMFPLNLRWIVKDLAQLCYSLRETGMGGEQHHELLRCYFAQAHVPCQWVIRWLLPLKIAFIARHDRKLRTRQPTRNISIGQANPKQ
jgi:tRNA A-37 threonylcarbamoyl transferase component Bud32